MNDNPKVFAALPGPDFPEDFAHRVIVQARREQSQRRFRSRLAAAACAVLLLGLVPLNRFLQHTSDASNTSSALWQDDSAEAIQLADATAPDEVSDYLAPDATRMSNWSGSYSDASWQYDSEWGND